LPSSEKHSSGFARAWLFCSYFFGRWTPEQNDRPTSRPGLSERGNEIWALIGDGNTRS